MFSVINPVAVLLTSRRSAVQYFYPDELAFDKATLRSEQMTSLAYIAGDEGDELLFMANRAGEVYEVLQSDVTNKVASPS